MLPKKNDEPKLFSRKNKVVRCPQEASNLTSARSEPWLGMAQDQEGNEFHRMESFDSFLSYIIIIKHFERAFLNAERGSWV